MSEGAMGLRHCIRALPSDTIPDLFLLEGWADDATVLGVTLRVAQFLKT